MPDTPFPNEIFSLKPLNQNAATVTSNTKNQHLAWSCEPGTLALSISYDNMRDTTTVVTIGREGDIVVDDPHISRIHCSFEINPSTGCILLHDRSAARTTRTETSGKSFAEHQVRRLVIVSPTMNPRFSIGSGEAHYRFEIVWRRSEESYRSALSQPNLRRQRAMTLTEEPTPRSALLSTGTTAQEAVKLRFAEWTPLGQRGSGAIHRAILLETGNLIAVKSTRLGSQTEHTIKAELRSLSRLSHPNIVRYLGSQDEDDGVHVLLELQTGSCEELGERHWFVGGPRDSLRAIPLLDSMLRALAFLHGHNIIHCDVKPANILYSRLTNSDDYHYVLSDFNLSLEADCSAVGRFGTEPFIAPEMDDEKQFDHKVDIWSLLVTMLWLHNTTNIRICTHSTQCYAVVDEFIGTSDSKLLRMMAARDPQLRATASECLSEMVRNSGGCGIGER